jgi:hypothetical protein
MMGKIFIFLFFVLYCGVTIQGQTQDSVWVIGGHKTLSSTYKLIRPEVIFDGRYTSALGDRVKMFGLRTGIELKRVHRMGFGLYGLSDPIVRSELSLVDDAVEESEFSFSYLSTFYERVLFFNRRWEVSVVGHVGLGSIRAKYRKQGETEFTEVPAISVRPIEVSSSAYYNITWWLSTGVGAGYRFMTRVPSEVASTYNSPIFIFKVKLRFGKIVRQMFNEEVKNEY